MSAIFLSASVPIEGRGNYHETADPFLIQCAVRELVMAVIRHHQQQIAMSDLPAIQIVWGGHPAITPMILSICQDLNIENSKMVVLYQSLFFKGRFPEENERFDNVVFTEEVPNDLKASLLRMRKEMLARQDLDAAVFIGGMEGVEDEYDLFIEHHPQAKVLPVAAPGGAALNLAKKIGVTEAKLHDVNFARLFHTELLDVSPPVPTPFVAKG